MNECTSCGKNFGSLEAFDAHRIGKYLQTGPGEYVDRVKKGLAPPPTEEEWKPEYGRRCLTTEEMQESDKFVINERNTWSLAKSLERVRGRFRTGKDAKGATVPDA